MELPPIALAQSRGAALPATDGASPALALAGAAKAGRSDAALHKAAESFEASFLAEMLQYTGINEMPSGFGGGAGEAAFSSLLTEQYANLLSERGGIGLAERIFEVLKQGKSGR